jgi:hypothetical protein
MGCMTGFHILAGAMVGFSLFTTMSRLAVEATQPPIQWFPGVKQLGHEVDHTPPSSADSQYICMALSWLTTGTTLPLPLYLAAAGVAKA